MKHLFITLILLTTALSMSAQRQISIIDDDSHQPVPNVVIADSAGIIAHGSSQGIAMLPERKLKVKVKIIFAQDNYDRLELDADSIPTVVKMHRREYMLDEVEVVGTKDQQIHFDLGLSKNEKAEAAYKSSGGNAFAWLSDKIFNAKDRKRKRKLEKLKEILDDY